MFESLDTWAAAVASATVLISAFLLVKKKIWIPGRAWFRRLENVIEEWEPNGGESSRDKISRIDAFAQSSQARVMILLDRDPVATYECNPSGECVYANRALCELYRKTRIEMRGNGWLDSVKVDDRERIYDQWHTAIEKDLPYEAYYELRTGEKIRTEATPMLSATGEVLAYHGTCEVVFDEKGDSP